MTADPGPAGNPLAGRRIGATSKTGRKAFKGMAPKGYRIRVMEPGEAQRLLSIERRAEATLIALGKTELLDAPKPEIFEFITFLIEHEVFVAEEKHSGEAIGFVAARDLGELYWISELSVDPDHQRRGIGRSLLSAVLERARWFQHRAVGLTTYADISVGAPFYRLSGFAAVCDADCPPWLRERKQAETPPGSPEEARSVMIRWL